MSEMGYRSRRRDFTIGIAAAVASVGIVRSPGRAAQFEWKMGSALAPDHPSSLRLTQMWAAIEQESGGRLRGQLFPAGQLGSDTGMLSQLRIGAMQVGYVAPGVLGAVVDAAGIAYVGFAFRDVEEAVKVMSGPLGDYVRQESAAKGLHVMRAMWNNGMLQIGTIPHPIRVPEDLRDLKIRCSESRIQVDMFKALGANPVTMNLSEEYTALQTKTVDGEVAPLSVLVTSKFYEVNRYVSLANHTWAGEYVVVNGDAWKSLPPDLQDIVERNNTKFGVMEVNDTRSADTALVARLRGFGLAVNSVDQTPFRRRLGPYYQALAGQFGPAVWNLLESGLGRKLG